MLTRTVNIANLTALTRARTSPMRWKPWIAVVVMLLATATLAWWQRHEYLHERELARQTLRRHAHSVMDALVGGIRAHRNRGPFFADQLQGSITGLVQSPDILAVAISADGGRLLLSAGEVDLLNTSPPIVAGDFWDPRGFRLVKRLDLPPAHRGPHGGGGRGRGGRGWGRGPPPGNAAELDAENPFFASGELVASLVLDRTQTDVRCRRAAWLRASIVAAGALVLFCVSLAWRVTVRAAGRTRALETEARNLRELGQAAAGLAHETRNPLGLIRGLTQRLAQSGLQSQEQREQAQSIVEECDRVTARINQFLAFARPPRPRCEPVDVRKLVDELALLLEPDLAAKNVTLNRAKLIPDKTVEADREMLRQALFNLIQNAIQASSAGQVVEISGGRGHDGGWRIEVADRGPGVPADMVASLFTPYFTTRPDGTGLGLAIVRPIASAHGWEVGHTPQPGGGSIFWMDRIRD
jgi:signal transduction histidine kinase